MNGWTLVLTWTPWTPNGCTSQFDTREEAMERADAHIRAYGEHPKFEAAVVETARMERIGR